MEQIGMSLYGLLPKLPGKFEKTYPVRTLEFILPQYSQRPREKKFYNIDTRPIFEKKARNRSSIYWCLVILPNHIFPTDTKQISFRGKELTWARGYDLS
jgi:hypothetical protein